MSIKYLSWGRPWLSSVSMLVWICIRIGAAVDTRGHDSHVTTDIQSLSTFMTSSAPRRWIVTWSDVQDVELITDSSSCHMIDVQEVELVLGYWLVDVIAVHVIAVHVIASTAETSRHVNIVVRDAAIMSTSDSWQHHHDVRNSFRFSLARLCQYKLFPGIISKASKSSYKSILF